MVVIRSEHLETLEAVIERRSAGFKHLPVARII